MFPLTEFQLSLTEEDVISLEKIVYLTSCSTSISSELNIYSRVVCPLRRGLWLEAPSNSSSKTVLSWWSTASLSATHPVCNFLSFYPEVAISNWNETMERRNVNGFRTPFIGTLARCSWIFSKNHLPRSNTQQTFNRAMVYSNCESGHNQKSDHNLKTLFCCCDAEQQKNL